MPIEAPERKEWAPISRTPCTPARRASRAGQETLQARHETSQGPRKFSWQEARNEPDPGGDLQGYGVENAGVCQAAKFLPSPLAGERPGVRGVRFAEAFPPPRPLARWGRGEPR